MKPATESSTLTSASFEDLVREMLVRLGEDPEREGLANTPERMRKAIHLALRLTEHPVWQDILRERVAPTDANLASDAALDAWLMSNIGTSHHISGTCKMGPGTDPLAVVDQHGRVHGIENLRVADASIMPDCIRANTNATTIMIGERIADFLKAER